MTVEFALRPRIRLREGLAPARRSRFRLPKFLVPAAAYWLAMAGLTYGFVRSREPAMARAERTAQVADERPRVTRRAWWQPLPELPRAASEAPLESAREAAGLVDAPAPPTPSPAPPATEPSAEPDTAEEAPSPLQAFLPDQPVTAARGSSDDERPRRTGEATAPSQPRSAPPAGRSAEEQPQRASAPAENAARAVAPSSGHDLPSCEAAVDGASQELDFSGGNRTADLPSQVIAAVLENGVWLSGCSVPETTLLEVCVAIRGGVVVGASVSTSPRDAALSACVRRRAAGLRFPYSSRLDVARTRF